MDVSWWDSQDSQENVTREFKISRPGQRDITGALWLPVELQADADTLICCGHGASGNRYQAPIPYLADRFTAEGSPVLSLDGPVHGLRQVGEGGRKAFGPEYVRDGALSEMTAEWHIAIDLVSQLPEINVSRLAYFGLSMGTIFGLPLVASRDDVTVATLGLFGIQDQTPHREAFLTACGEVRCPVFYLMQLEDVLFSREGYLTAFDALASKDKVIHANPGLHPEVPAVEVEYAVAFMLSHLRGEANTHIVNIIAD